MSEKESLVELQIKIPKDVISDEFDVEEVRIAVEEAVEELIKKAMSVDDSEPCESVSTTIYRTNTAFAERVDFCLGRLGDGRHVHAEEEYGSNLNEYWYYLEAFAKSVEEDE